MGSNEVGTPLSSVADLDSVGEALVPSSDVYNLKLTGSLGWANLTLYQLAGFIL